MVVQLIDVELLLTVAVFQLLSGPGKLAASKSYLTMARERT
jgi:hypothetical protein